ncbi:MAG TPA: ABC transporter substrate-binding protein [Candidatus Acidoferrales bacterium]|nr:ABC transporter substrate-binding protein [Candidatus Acidoferrales bacterium]
MRNNILYLTLSALLFALCVSAEAQQPTRTARIGYLEDGNAAASAELIHAFRQQMTEFGWIEGKNLIIEYRFGEGKGEKRLADLAAELVRLNVDVILVNATSATLAAKKATSAIPIVMSSVGDPVGRGIVASLARPGGNITGLASLTDELGGKRLEILKDAIPRATRIGILMGSRRGPGGQRQVEAIKAAAAGFGLTSEEFGATDAEDSEKAFRTLAHQQFHAFITTSGPAILAAKRRILMLAGQYRLPGIFPQKEFVDEGGLMSYGVDRGGQYRHGAVYVDKILKGAKPSDLPVEQPTKFELVINLKAAKQIGLTIPQSVLYRADRVIK